MLLKRFKSRINGLDNYEVGVLSIRVVETVKSANIEKIVQDPAYLNFLSVNDQYQIALAPNEIENLKLLSRQYAEGRKQSFLNLYDYTEGLTKSPDAKVAAAASNIFKILDLYGRGFVYQRLAGQAICYFRVIEQLLKPENAEDVATAGITEAVIDFDKIQKSYEQSYIALGNAMAGNMVPSKLRRQMNTALKLFFESTRVQAITSKDEALITLYNKMMMRLEEVDTARRKRKEEGADDMDSDINDTEFPSSNPTPTDKP